MKPHTPEYIEGPEAAARFDAMMEKLFSVPTLNHCAARESLSKEGR
jgi:hypothetical protein